MTYFSLGKRTLSLRVTTNSCKKNYPEVWAKIAPKERRMLPVFFMHTTESTVESWQKTVNASLHLSSYCCCRLLHAIFCLNSIHFSRLHFIFTWAYVFLVSLDSLICVSIFLSVHFRHHFEISKSMQLQRDARFLLGADFGWSCENCSHSVSAHISNDRAQSNIFRWFLIFFHFVVCFPSCVLHHAHFARRACVSSIQHFFCWPSLAFVLWFFDMECVRSVFLFFFEFRSFCCCRAFLRCLCQFVGQHLAMITNFFLCSRSSFAAACFHLSAYFDNRLVPKGKVKIKYSSSSWQLQHEYLNRKCARFWCRTVFKGKTVDFISCSFIRQPDDYSRRYCYGYGYDSEYYYVSY